MRHRLFIAVNLTDAARREVMKIREEVERKLTPEELREVRFMPPENWHLTVSFLGYKDDAEFPMILRAAETAAKHFPAPEIVFSELSYGPPRGNTKRMIWIQTTDETSKNMSAVKEFLEDRLVAERVPFAMEMRPFSGHITLARFASEISDVSLPPLRRVLHLRVPAASLDLMESTLRRGGAEYAVLQKFPFSNL